jgi:hypothetical protein
MILYLNRAFHGSQRTREFGERAVTRSLDKSPFVAGEARRNQFSLKPLELSVGRFLSVM